MLGNERRLVAVDKRLEPLEMRLIERLRAADRHANAVERNRVVLADLVECSVGWTAGTHVVFGVDFKEAISLPVGKDRLQMFVLEAAVAKDASAVATAPARTTAPTVDLDILLLHSG